MGRARTQKRAAATGNFNSILGKNRGSAAAQAQRDLTERIQLRAQQDRDLQTFSDLVVAGCSALEVNTVYVDTLIIAYSRKQHSTEETTVILTKMLQERTQPSQEDAFEVLASMLVVGDPVSSPGLTAPVLKTLCDYFRKGDIEYPQAATTNAKIVMTRLFSQSLKRPEDYYQRLQPLCESLARLLSNPWGEDVNALRMVAAGILLSVPESALTGPLRSWIKEFEYCTSEKFDGVPLSERAHLQRELRAVVTKYNPGSAGGQALEGLAANLYEPFEAVKTEWRRSHS